MKRAAVLIGAAAVLLAAVPAAAEQGDIAVGGAPAADARSASLDCTGAEAIAADAERALERAKRKLRRAKRSGRAARIDRARRKVRAAREDLAGARETAEDACTGLYLSLGDSIAGSAGASPGHGYVELMLDHYRIALGVTKLMRFGGSTSDDFRAILPRVVAEIDLATDTMVITAGIGGHDFLRGCRFGASDCTNAYRSNLSAIFAGLQSALADDPGDELVIAVGYHNPAVGEPGEADADRTLLGENSTLGCSDAGADVGMSDAMAQEAARHGLLFADPYPAFKSGGQSYMSDDLHPNDAGYRAFADAVLAATARC